MIHRLPKQRAQRLCTVLRSRRGRCFRACTPTISSPQTKPKPNDIVCACRLLRALRAQIAVFFSRKLAKSSRYFTLRMRRSAMKLRFSVYKNDSNMKKKSGREKRSPISAPQMRLFAASRRNKNDSKMKKEGERNSRPQKSRAARPAKRGRMRSAKK